MRRLYESLQNHEIQLRSYHSAISSNDVRHLIQLGGDCDIDTILISQFFTDLLYGVIT